MKGLRQIITVIFLLNSSILSGQDISIKYNDLINRVEQIEKDNSFEKVTLENEELMSQMSDGGGELTGYFKRGKVQKITMKLGFSYGVSTSHYYFSEGKLIFIKKVLEKFPYIESEANFDYSNLVTSFVGNYYFRNEKLIDSDFRGQNDFEKQSNHTETILLNEVEDYKDKLEGRI